ncbi:MAG: nitrogen fixation-related uncharacterized protein [Chlamydiales bacterium]|jgi:nitrogen fixation-related uncharacterized protein
MGSFLRENWPYIVIPIALALIGVAILVYLSGGDSETQFIYDIM